LILPSLVLSAWGDNACPFEFPPAHPTE
jgi:hypothetical protein